MGNIQVEKRQELVFTLMYKGKVAAIKQYISLTNCRVREAMKAIDRLAMDIEPGPTGEN